jgi:hypothetical protein
VCSLSNLDVEVNLRDEVERDRVEGDLLLPFRVCNREVELI